MFSNLKLVSQQGNGGAELKRIVMSSKIAGLMAGSVAFVNLFCSGIGQVFMCACAGVSDWVKADFASRGCTVKYMGWGEAHIQRFYQERVFQKAFFGFPRILCKQSIAVGVCDERLATCFPQTSYTCDTSVSRMPLSHFRTFKKTLLSVTIRLKKTNKYVHNEI